MRRFTFALLILIALLAVGCSNDTPVAPSKDPGIPTVDTSELERLERIANQADGGIATLTRGVRTVVVPAGSSDALAAAINDAGRGGIVVLKSGSHTESATVSVEIPVTILGEKGAQLISSAGEPSNLIPTPIVPALYVRADGVSIQGIKFLSAPGDGNTVVLIQDADDVLVFNNTMTGFQWGILVDHGDRARLWSNMIVGSGGWLTGALGDVEGIILINGSYGSVLKNDASNCLFGIFPCGSNGILALNKSHDNFLGIILCRVPAESFLMPNGALTGAEINTNHWLATENTTVNNLTTGFLSIDGANHNLIVSNASSGNGTYDVELAGDTYRFGFFVPMCHDETFIAGRYATVEIKNCGANNTVIGGSLVDNTIEPCD
jgi:hypothetical protein